MTYSWRDALSDIGKALNNKIATKIYYFNTVSDMKASNILKAGDMVITKGYYTANDGGNGEYEVVNDASLVDDGGSVHNVCDGLKAKLIIKSEINIKQFGAKGDGVSDDTECIQKAFNLSGHILCPIGTYILSKKLYIKKNSFIDCNKNCEFKYASGLNLTNVAEMCIGNEFSDEVSGYIKWNGGIINGNGSNQPNLDDVNVWNHDYCRALLIGSCDEVQITNLVVKDIFGHAIGHWNNNNFTVSHIKILQSTVNSHPQGASRRDGITGSSRKININDVTGFTDDDFIAVCSNQSWTKFPACSVESVNISNINSIANDKKADRYCMRMFAFYNTNRDKLAQINIENVKGYYNTSFVKLMGGANQINFKNIDCIINREYDIDYVFWNLGFNTNSITLDNINIVMDTNKLNSFIVNEDMTSIDCLILNNFKINNLNITADNTKNFIENRINSFINKIYANDLKYDTKTESDYNFLNHIIDQNKLNELYHGTGVNNTIEYSFVTELVPRSYIFAVLLGYNKISNGNSIKIKSISLKKNGTDSNLIDLTSMAPNDGCTFSNNILTGISATNTWSGIFTNEIPLDISTSYIFSLQYEIISGSDPTLQIKYKNTVIDYSNKTVYIDGNIYKNGKIGKINIKNNDKSPQIKLLNNIEESNDVINKGVISILSDKLIFDTNRLSNFKEKNGFVAGNISLTCESLNFSYEFKTNLIRVTGITPPSKQIPCVGIVTTSAGQINQCFPLIVPEENGFVIYMLDYHTNTDIRLISLSNICYFV